MLDPEDEGTTVLWNSETYSPNDRTSYPRRLISASLGSYVQISPSKIALAVMFLTCIQEVPSLSLFWDTVIPEVYHDSSQSFQADSKTKPELSITWWNLLWLKAVLGGSNTSFGLWLHHQDCDMTCAQSSLFPCLHEAGLIVVHKWKKLVGCYETGFLWVYNWNSLGACCSLKHWCIWTVWWNCQPQKVLLNFETMKASRYVVCGHFIQHPFQFVSH